MGPLCWATKWISRYWNVTPFKKCCQYSALSTWFLTWGIRWRIPSVGVRDLACRRLYYAVNRWMSWKLAWYERRRLTIFLSAERTDFKFLDTANSFVSDAGGCAEYRHMRALICILLRWLSVALRPDPQHDVWQPRHIENGFFSIFFSSSYGVIRATSLPTLPIPLSYQ